MTQQDRKKAAVLGVLVLALAGYWGYGLVSGWLHKKVPAATENNAGKKKAGGPPALTPPPAVDLGLLDRPREEYSSSRNMFAPVYRKPELAKPGVQKSPITAQPVLPPAPPPPPPPPPKSAKELAEDAAMADLAKFKLLGFVKSKGRMSVFLTFEGGSYVVSEGGLIAKDYYLTDVGQDSITITSKDTGTEVVLGMKPEAAAKSPPPAAAPPGGVQKKRVVPRPDQGPRTGGSAGREPAGGQPQRDYGTLDNLPPVPEPGSTSGGGVVTTGGAGRSKTPGGMRGNSLIRSK